MKLIGLSGKMGSGKNYIAEKVIAPYFADKYNILIIGFGDQVKNELYARDENLTYDLLYDNKSFESRKKLQEYATENGRDKYNKDMWVRGLDIQIETFAKRSPKPPMVIVCDVRFVNEANYIRNKDGVIFRIKAPQRTQIRYWKEANGDKEKFNNICNHSSETELDNYNFQSIINNDVELNKDFLENLKI